MQKMNALNSIAYAVGVIETSAHIHYESEMAIVHKGCLKISIDGISYTISEGGIFFINPMSVHSYKTEEPFTLLTFLGVSKSFTENLFPDLRNKRIQFVVSNEKNNSTIVNRIRTLLMAIYKNSIYDDEYHAALNQSAAIFILTLLHKHFLTDSNQSDMLDSDDFDRNRLIESYILENYNKKINLKMLADHIHLSSYYTSHYFKNFFQVTFVQYLSSLRIVNAKYLLHKKNLSITEIAHSCGFDNGANFSRVFKNIEGISPTEYRKMRISMNAFFFGKGASGMYGTKSGFYIAFNQERHRSFFKERFKKTKHIDIHIFDIFTV